MRSLSLKMCSRCVEIWAPRIYPIGIDLGTTYSSVAVYRDGTAEVIPDKNGDRLIPSIVFFDPLSGKPTVGKSAINLGVRCPANCLKDAKRIIGRKFDDDYISRVCNLKTTDFMLARWTDDSTVYQLTIGGRKSFKTPEEVIAHILVYLKQMASEYLNTKVKEVVVAIPAHFSISQRLAMKKAVELAGLKLLKFISETSAGALHYIRDTNKVSKILAFDWGGGKIDVSAIILKDKIFEVKAVAGNTLLGGTDIDERLLKFHSGCFTSRIKHRLMKGCVDLKHQLSSNSEYSVTIDCYDGLNDLNLVLSRSELEDINKDIIQKVINTIDLCVDDAGWTIDSIDELALLGGSTRMPKIREQVMTKFPGVTMRSDFNPDEAVAAGACLEAFWIRNPSKSNCKMIHATPLSIGLECYGHFMDVFIERNSSLPVKKSKRFRTSENYQENVTFKIYEGDRENCLHNYKLGEFNIYGLPPMKAGEFEFIVTFVMDHNGFLKIEASEDSDGETNNLLIKTVI
ncbi:heat shock 70 kDa protein isoform X2 [Leptinotarsa decemlineata]|uniref:heat shock 70 kDa protein isoform X2 n=1 Tax=Leptinotarsa decemlineata TaxID=7539 RepID=UPI003D309E65